MSALWVEITATRGSAPRDAGTAMMVTPEKIKGTIGGGALELSAITTARKMLDANETKYHETLPLGPNLGQCCGGAVTLHYTNQEKPTDRLGPLVCEAAPVPEQAIPLWIWGAGHVGRAVVDACAPHVADITWIDSTQARFPHQVRKDITLVPAANMPRLAARAPVNVHHLIFTYSHEIDLGLCGALLHRNAASIGLIGSDTKWARFSKRLRQMSLDPTPITCPIGDKSLGKQPAQIAQGAIAALLSRTNSKALA